MKDPKQVKEALMNAIDWLAVFTCFLEKSAPRSLRAKRLLKTWSKDPLYIRVQNNRG